MIIVGTNYKVYNTVNIDLTGMVSATIHIQPPSGDALVLNATASGTNTLYADVSPAQNITTGGHRVWSEVLFLGGVIRKSGARTFNIWPEGSLQVAE